MTERSSLEQILDEALLPVFGDNLQKAYEENARHDTALREIPVRLEQEFDNKVSRLMYEEFEGYERTERIRELRVRYVNRIRDAMVAEHAIHRLNIEALEIKE